MNFSRGVGGSLLYLWKFRRGGGGHQFPAKMENPGRWGGPKWNSLRGGGLDIFWNYTLGSLEQVDFLTGQITFKAFCPMSKGCLVRGVRSDPWQAKCNSYFPKGQAGIQVFFSSPVTRLSHLSIWLVLNSFLPSKLLVPHTVKSH